MRKIYIILISIVPILISCQSDTIFRKYYQFDDYQWDKDKNIIFNVNINDIKSKYDVIIAVRHTSQYPYANLQINLTFYSPSGQERTKDHNLFLRNNDGSFKGSVMGNIYDMEFEVLKKINFTEQGTYKFEINSLMPKYTTPALMDIGLIIKKSK